MQVRCPSCRKVTTIPQELVEYLARCERCGAMLHVRASALGPEPAESARPSAKTLGKRKRVVARAIPRPVAVQSDRLSSGIFDLPRTERHATAHAGRVDDALARAPLDDAADAVVAMLAAEHAPKRRPAHPPAPRRHLKRVLGFVALGLLAILALWVVEIIYWHLLG